MEAYGHIVYNIYMAYGAFYNYKIGSSVPGYLICLVCADNLRMRLKSKNNMGHALK